MYRFHAKSVWWSNRFHISHSTRDNELLPVYTTRLVLRGDSAIICTKCTAKHVFIHAPRVLVNNDGCHQNSVKKIFLWLYRNLKNKVLHVVQRKESRGVKSGDAGVEGVGPPLAIHFSWIFGGDVRGRQMKSARVLHPIGTIYAAVVPVEIFQ